MTVRFADRPRDVEREQGRKRKQEANPKTTANEYTLPPGCTPSNSGTVAATMKYVAVITHFIESLSEHQPMSRRPAMLDQRIQRVAVDHSALSCAWLVKP